MSFHHSTILLLLALGAVAGQQPDPPVAAPAPKPAASLGETKIVEDIIEPKLTGSGLAALYWKYTGHRVIVAAAAATAEISFVQEASPEDPLTYAEAAALLKKAATLENLVFVPDGQNPQLEILTLAGAGPNPARLGVAVHKDSKSLPAGDEVIAYVMTLQFLKPADAVKALAKRLGQDGAVAAVADSSSVSITAKASVIRKLIELKPEIDKP